MLNNVNLSKSCKFMINIDEIRNKSDIVKSINKK